MWCLELNSGIGETRLLAAIGVNALAAAKGILQDDFEQTKECKPIRSVLGYLNLMDSRFRRPTEERATQRIAQWNNLAKKSSESLQEYWARYGRLKYTLEALGATWPGKIALAKAFESPRLNNEQQALSKASLEISTNRESLPELQRIASRLFDVHTQKVEDVCLADDDTGEDGQFGEETWEEWEMQPTRRVKPKPKRGATSRSITNASTTFGYGSGKSKPGEEKGSGRSNFGEAAHWWGNRPNLQAKRDVVGKGKSKSGKGAKKKGNQQRRR